MWSENNNQTTQNESFNGVEIYFYWIELLKRANFNTHFFIGFSIHKRNKNQMFLLCSGNERESEIDIWRKSSTRKWDGTYLLSHSLKSVECVGLVRLVRVLLSLSSSMVFYSIYMLFLFIIMASVLLSSWLVKIGVPIRQCSGAGGFSLLLSLDFLIFRTNSLEMGNIFRNFLQFYNFWNRNVWEKFFRAHNRLPHPFCDGWRRSPLRICRNETSELFSDSKSRRFN